MSNKKKEGIYCNNNKCSNKGDRIKRKNVRYLCEYCYKQFEEWRDGN